MDGNLAYYIVRKENRRNSKLKNFYKNLRECNTDLFVVDNYYVVALRDKERMFNRDETIIKNLEDVSEISNILGISKDSIEEYFDAHKVDRLRKIDPLEYGPFKDKGINQICNKGYFELPQNMIEAYRRD